MKSRPAQRGGNRQHILEQVRHILRTSSYDGFSVDELALQSGLSRRAIYNHFPRKDELYRASREALLQQLATRVPGDIPPAMPMSTALCNFAQELTSVLASDQNQELVGSIVRDAETQSWLLPSYHRQVIQPALRALEVFLYAKRLERVFDCRDVSGAAILFIHMLQSATPSRYVGPLVSCLPCTPQLQVQMTDALVRSFLIQFGAEAGARRSAVRRHASA